MAADNPEDMEVGEDEAQKNEVQTEAPDPDTPVAASSGSVEKNKKPRFEVKKWNAVAVWAWDIDVDQCAICKFALSDRCNDCQANHPDAAPTVIAGGEECTIAWGSCNHAYHLHCINRWLKTRQVCPLDNSQWVFQKFGR